MLIKFYFLLSDITVFLKKTRMATFIKTKLNKLGKQTLTLLM